MQNLSHLMSLHALKITAQDLLTFAKKPQEKAWRAARVEQLDKEISAEAEFLAQSGIEVPAWLGADRDLFEMSDDELEAELSA